MWILWLILMVGQVYCIMHIRKLNRIIDQRGAPPTPPPANVVPVGKTARDICRDLLDEHERRLHRS